MRRKLDGALRLRHDFGRHRTAEYALVGLNAVVVAMGLALTVLVSVSDDDALWEGDDSVMNLMGTMGKGSLLLGIMGLIGVLRYKDVLFVYFVVLALLLVVAVWGVCMALAHQEQVQNEVRTKAARNWPAYYALLPGDVQLAANASQATAGGCFEAYSLPCWKAVKDDLGGKSFAAAGSLLLVLVALMIGALYCSKQIISVDRIVVKTELMLAHIGLMSGWVLLGLAFQIPEEKGASSVIGETLKGAFIVTGSLLTGLSFWSYCNLYLPKKAPVSAHRMRKMNAYLLSVIGLMLLLLSTQLFFAKDRVLDTLHHSLTEDDLDDLLKMYQEIEGCNETKAQNKVRLALAAAKANQKWRSSTAAADAQMGIVAGTNTSAGCCQLGAETQLSDVVICHGNHGTRCTESTRTIGHGTPPPPPPPTTTWPPHPCMTPPHDTHGKWSTKAKSYSKGIQVVLQCDNGYLPSSDPGETADAASKMTCGDDGKIYLTTGRSNKITN